jgi:hypothetical protein
LLSDSLSEANKLFCAKRYEEAIPLYQNYLQNNFNKDIQIDGLGNYDQALGYYEWYP